MAKADIRVPKKIPTFSSRNNHYEAEMHTSSQLAASFHWCDTRSSVSQYSFLSPHLSLSSLHPFLHICRLCHTHFKRPWGVSVIPQCTSEKTWHAFRAQLPNASHYYRSSSTIIPWGKGATEPTQHLPTPPWVMDLWYPPPPLHMEPSSHTHKQHTNSASISLHYSHMLRTQWLNLSWSIYAYINTIFM